MRGYAQAFATGIAFAILVDDLGGKRWSVALSFASATINGVVMVSYVVSLIRARRKLKKLQSQFT